MSEGRNTELVSDLVRAVSLRCHSHPGPERRAAIERAETAKEALLAALESTSRALSEKEGENTRLRAALAQSDQPCAYCSLPKDEWAKCASGFPGCDRADDAMGCPELGARLALDEALAALKASEERGERLSQELASARCPQEPWQPIDTAPKTGEVFLGTAPMEPWPSAMLWQAYDADDAAELGEAGFWAFAEQLVSDVEGQAKPTHWMPLVPQPQGSGPNLADATKKDPGTEQREAGV